MAPSASGSTDARPVLYLVACAAPPVLGIVAGVAAARASGWDTCLILTPSAARWLARDLAELRALTGHPVRTEYKLPGEPDVLPPPAAILAAPITSNSVNKWAAGISDTLALGLITEAIGKRLPITAMPSLNDEQAAHPAFVRSVDLLRTAGVTVLLDAERCAFRDTGSGYPWYIGLSALPAPGAPRDSHNSAS